MYTAKDTEVNKLEIFKQNENWQKVIDEFLDAWNKYFKQEGAPPRLSLTDSSVLVCFDNDSWDGYVANCLLQVINIKRALAWPRLRNKTMVIDFRRWPRNEWGIVSINYNHLLDIIAATRLLCDGTLDPEPARKAHEDRMQFFNDYLDGLAEVL